MRLESRPMNAKRSTLVRIRRWLCPVFATVAMLACGAPQAPEAAKSAIHARAVCKAGTTQPKPLVVEWPTELRADLEARAKRGPVVVHYEGCVMDVLERCKAPGTYHYAAVSPKTETVTITNERELYASLPLGAMGLEAKLRAKGQLTIDMVLVGKWLADRPGYAPEDLRGDCAGATHVISGMAIGAFSFRSGSGSDASAGATGSGMGAGGRFSSSEEILMTDGNMKACSQADPTSGVPVAGCAGLVRLDTVAIGAMPTSSDGTALESIKRIIQALQLAPVVLPIPKELSIGARDEVIKAYVMVGRPADANAFFRSYFREQSVAMLGELVRAYLREDKVAEGIIVAEDLADHESERACIARPPVLVHGLSGSLNDKYARLLAQYTELCGEKTPTPG